MRLARVFAAQVVYHEFIVSPTTCVGAKRLNTAYRIEARLDLDRLDRAVRGVVAAHDSLRTALDYVDGELTQVIREPDEIDVPALRVSPWDGTPEHTARLVGALDAWWTVPRPLAIQVIAGHGPGDETLVACVCNHASCDGISIDVIFDQIRLTYQRFEDRPRHETVTQFNDYYAALLRDGTAEAYDDWVRQIDRTAPAVPQWMFDRKLATDDVRIQIHEWEFAPDSVDRLHRIRKAHACSEFEVLATCVGLYFRRSDGRPAAIAVTHGGRQRPGGFAAAGLLRSEVVDAVSHAGVDSVADAIVRRRTELRALLAHQGKLPSDEFCRLAGRSPGWFKGEAGLWEVELNGMFQPEDFEPFDGATVRPAAIPLSEDEYCENGGPIFLLAFNFGPDRVRGALRYVTPPANDTLARTIAGQLESILRIVRDEPATPIRDVPALYEVAGLDPLQDVQ